MQLTETENDFPYMLICPFCGGEVKKVIINVYEISYIQKIISYRCKECSKLFSKLDDIDILI